MASELKLTKNEANRIFEKIKDVCDDDPEAAHSIEDRLMIKFIANIADGTLTDPLEIKEIATIINKINYLKYSRYYA